ncbi:hypothetical protein AVEN_218408-1, partial [Araneus ventricosus]
MSEGGRSRSSLSSIFQNSSTTLATYMTSHYDGWIPALLQETWIRKVAAALDQNGY